MQTWHPNGTKAPSPLPIRGKARRKSYGSAKISEEYVRCIRAAFDEGKTVAQLLKLFPKITSQAGMHAIATRTAWRHVR